LELLSSCHSNVTQVGEEPTVVAVLKISQDPKTPWAIHFAGAEEACEILSNRYQLCPGKNQKSTRHEALVVPFTPKIQWGLIVLHC